MFQLDQGILPADFESGAQEVWQRYCQVQGRAQTHKQRVQDCVGKLSIENCQDCINNRQGVRIKKNYGVFLFQVCSLKPQEPRIHA